MAPIIPKSGNTKLYTATNLAILLPTGTALSFQALMPYITNSGSCRPVHKYLTASAIIIFSLVCLISSFTDSFIASNGKLYYGIATFKGLFIFNKDDNDNDTDSNKTEEGNQSQPYEGGKINIHTEDAGGDLQKKLLETSAKEYDESEKIILAKLANYRIQFIDFVHAFLTWLVFVVYATCSSDVQRCYSPHPNDTLNVLMMNLPMGVGAAVSFVFMLFPTKRRGIGFADIEKRLGNEE